jgi:hypothetical protein
MDTNGLKTDTAIKLKKAQNSQSTHRNKRRKNLVNCFRNSVGNSYYEVSQHEKFQLNIHSFKHELNTIQLKPRTSQNGNLAGTRQTDP